MNRIQGQNLPANPTLPWAPDKYDVTQFNRMIQVLQQWMTRIGNDTRNPTFINVIGMPTTGNLLPVGTVYIDSDVLRVVVSGAMYAPSYGLTASVGTVSWTLT